MNSKFGLTGVSILFVLATVAACGGGGGGGGAGSTSPLSPVAAGNQPVSVTADPSGKFAYVANIGSNDVSAYTIAATVGPMGVSAPVVALMVYVETLLERAFAT